MQNGNRILPEDLDMNITRLKARIFDLQRALQQSLQYLAEAEQAQALAQRTPEAPALKEGG